MISASLHSRCFKKRSAYALLEVLVSIAILSAGIIAIIYLFPFSLQAINEAAMVSEAALLAQWKAEEIRKDDIDDSPDAIETIQNMTEPFPTDGIPFEQNNHLTYSYCGVSLLDPVDTPGDPRDDVGVARIIVRKNKNIDPTMKVIYELEFDR